MEWIQVSERLPEVPENCWRQEKPIILLGEDNFVYTGFYAKWDGYYFGISVPFNFVVSQQFDSLNQTVIKAKAWMHLPEPPPCNCGFQHNEKYN